MAIFLRHLFRLKRRVLITLIPLLGIITSVNALEIETILFEKSRLRLVQVNLKTDNLQLFWQDENGEAFGSFSRLSQALAKKNQTLLFAINSGIYTKDYTPLGLHIEQGKQLAPLNLVRSNAGVGNFSLLPNGVFYLAEDLSTAIMTTDDFQAQSQGQLQGKYQGGRQKTTPWYATQSGPMLLIDGAYNPRFIKNSSSRKIRSGVCVQGTTVSFVVTETEVSFYTFARFFKEALACTDALYLDGTLAKLYYQGRTYGAPFWQTKPLVGIWGVTEPH